MIKTTTIPVGSDRSYFLELFPGGAFGGGGALRFVSSSSYSLVNTVEKTTNNSKLQKDNSASAEILGIVFFGRKLFSSAISSTILDKL